MDLRKYVELNAISNFSFLQGASHPEELINQARLMQYHGIGIADYTTLAGAVRAYTGAKMANIPHIIGCRLKIQAPPDEHAHEIIVYPTSREEYGCISRAITLIWQEHSNKTMIKNPIGSLHDLANYLNGSQIIVIPNNDMLGHCDRYKQSFQNILKKMINYYGKDKISISLHNNLTSADTYSNKTILQSSEYNKIPYVITGSVIYHIKSRKKLFDVLTCIKHKKTIFSAGRLLSQNAENYLRPVSELERIFNHCEQGFERGLYIFEEAQKFNLQQIKCEYPDLNTDDLQYSPYERLCLEVEQGLKERYPGGVPEKIKQIIKSELAIIKELKYEKYFLICHDIVRFANSKNILCQGRGAAANSAVCYCLGITSVDPNQIDTLFARFISKERNEPPDIDIDFEHERKQEIIDYLYSKYSHKHAALVAEVVTYRTKSSIRDVAKVFNLPNYKINQLTKLAHHWKKGSISSAEICKIGLDPDSPTIQIIQEMVLEMKGFPRHLSQHNGGFIISQTPIDEIVPVKMVSDGTRSIIEWNKDDIDALGILKIDILSLGILTCIHKTLDLINNADAHSHTPNYSHPLNLSNIPADCQLTYDMICNSDTLGVFQIESRAQMSMLPRLKPRCYYDLVIEIAIVRPGPIQGKMVHPYLRRRAGLETFNHPDDRVIQILGKTLGVPLFQEQAMRLAIELAGFTPGEADLLRKSISSWEKNTSLVAYFTERIIIGMQSKGYDRDFALYCISQLRSFSSYGFPESHAASFAHLVYASAWLKHHHPAAFAVGLLNSQPMGFYAPAQIINYFKRSNVSFMDPDINHSYWYYTITQGGSTKTGPIRTGLLTIKDVRKKQVELIELARQNFGQFQTIDEIWLNMWQTYQKIEHLEKPLRQTLESLARGDCFGSLGLNSREALWRIKNLKTPDTYYQNLPLVKESHPKLPIMNRYQVIDLHYEKRGFNLTGHPIEKIRKYIYARRKQYAFMNLNKIRDSAELTRQINELEINGSACLFLAKRPVATIGIIICRQKPPTARGVAFLTLEDEKGIMNVTIYPNLFNKRFNDIAYSSAVYVSGILQNIGSVVYILANDIRYLA